MFVLVLDIVVIFAKFKQLLNATIIKTKPKKLPVLSCLFNKMFAGQLVGNSAQTCMVSGSVQVPVGSSKKRLFIYSILILILPPFPLCR